jgi:hypothetical protein
MTHKDRSRPAGILDERDCGSRGPPFEPGWRYHKNQILTFLFRRRCFPKERLGSTWEAAATKKRFGAVVHSDPKVQAKCDASFEHTSAEGI